MNIFRLSTFGFRLFMMIGFAFEDGHSAVELFYKEGTYHLVGEGETAEGKQTVGALIDCLGEAVGSADGKDDIASSGHFLLQQVGQFDAARFLTPFVQQDEFCRIGYST